MSSETIAAEKRGKALIGSALTIDDPVKSRKCPGIVIPVKTGIQKFKHLTKYWTPVFTGVTTFYEAVTIGTGIVQRIHGNVKWKMEKV